MENNNLITSELQIDATGYVHLKETARWAKFLAIVGFILCALMVLMAVFGVSLFNSFNKVNRELNPQAVAINGTMLAIIYLVIAVIYFFLCLFLYRFAGKMQAALVSSDQDSLNGSFYNLKMMYRMTGIIVLVYISIVILALIVSIAAAAFMR